MFNLLALLTIGALPLALAGCARLTSGGGASPVYRVQRLTQPLTIDAQWDKAPWRRVEPLTLEYFMGEQPEHRPFTQAKLLYDDENVYVIFRVEDRFVRAVATETHGPVWKDSCAEFFFTPGADVEEGYFNLEVNCGGTPLFHFQKEPRTNQIPLAPEEMRQIEIAHSMPRTVEPELAEPTIWTIEYRIPVAVLERYRSVVRPRPGAIWRANFYKIADDTSHPHWLTWARIDKPTPDFHQPHFFGTLEFR